MKKSVYLRALTMNDIERTHRWHNDADLYESLVGNFRHVSIEAEKKMAGKKGLLFAQ